MPDFPRGIVEFQHWFPDDDACREYLIDSRWLEGYRCPRCGSTEAVLLRRAMVNPERHLLTEEVEVDECFVGSLDRELRGGGQHGTKALVAVAVEVRGSASGRVRMQVVPDASTATLCGFVTDLVAEGGVVHTNGWNAYRRLSTFGYDHRPRTQKPGRIAVDDLDEILPRVRRVISNLKTWLQGTHRGVSKEHLQVYLDEYVFRFNRGRTPMAAFQTLLGLGGQHSPTTYRQIYAEGPASRARRDPSMS